MENTVALLASRGQFLEKTSGGSLDLCKWEVSSFTATAYLNSILAHLRCNCVFFESQKLGSNGSHKEGERQPRLLMSMISL